MKDRIFFGCGKRTISVCLNDIIHIQFDNGLSKVWILEKPSLTCAESLSCLKARLPEDFIQTNRNTIIHISQIISIDWENLSVHLTDNHVAGISYRRKRELKLRLNGIRNTKNS